MRASDMSSPRTLRVSVPATAANLGAGFDVLGLALDLHNEFSLIPADSLHIAISGYGESLPADETSLFYRSLAHLCALAGKPVPPLHISMDLRVPPGKGLGSSATAVVGGLVAANALLDGPFGVDVLLREAVDLEQGQHADNVASALLGGLVVNDTSGAEVVSVQVPFPEELKAVVLTPDFPMDTVSGRALMPSHYPRADVIFSTGRVALFLAALNLRRYDLLASAMQDRLHQPYRAQIFPGMADLIWAAIEAGAHGACLSGGGSSILALATERLEEIGEALVRAAGEHGIEGDVRILEIDRVGAVATWEEDTP
jgi:homoserine kinase